MNETQRRIRAARAYADLTIDELAEKIGLGRQTVVRMERGERDPKRMELNEIADATGVPRTFMHHGFMEQAASAATQMFDAADQALHRAGDQIARIDGLMAELDAREAAISAREEAAGTTRVSREDQDASLREEDALRQVEPLDEGQGRHRAGR